MKEAISKIKSEIEGNKNNPYIKVIGYFLIKHIEENPDASEKILAKDKTIAKSLEAMKSEAKKKQHNGMAMLTDAEGFAIVLKYFGIEGAAPADPVPAVPTPAPAPAALESSYFDVKLDDFL